jgi:hypothetical protein
LNNRDSKVDSDKDEAIEEEAAVSEADAQEGDGGKSVHDDSVVKSIRGKAIQIMKNKGVVIAREDGKWRSNISLG